VIAPGGLGTLDELFEVLTLIQTKKITAAPVILIGSQFWAGLIGWIQAQLLTQAYIHNDDLNLWVIADDEEAVVAAIKAHPRHAA
jgi:predicted Rossmann-fold nucleotide-binding protein